MVHLTICSCHVRYAFENECKIYSCLNVKELLAQSRSKIWSWTDCNWTRTHNHLVCKRTLKHLVKLTKWLSCVLSTCLHGPFDCMFLSCQVRISKWITFYSWGNVKELLAQSSREIRSLSDCKWTRTQNHLVCPRTLNYLAKLTKLLRCVLSTYLYGAFDWIFLSCHLRISEWIHTL